MAAHDSENSRISFSMREPSLRDCAPPSLQRAGSIRSQFETRKLGNTLSQENHPGSDFCRREDSGSGSQMIKSQKPFPELKPRNSYELKKVFFDQAWLREQRQAQLDHFSVQRQSAPQQNRQSEPVWER